MPDKPNKTSTTRQGGKHPGGRPTKYTKELGKKICSEIADNKSLRTICSAKAMPAPKTIIAWLAHPSELYDEFRKQYAHSREMQADVIYEDIISIEADLRAGVIDPHTARVLIDSHKWRAGKMRPKVYGDLKEVKHTGGVTVELVRFADEPDED